MFETVWKKKNNLNFFENSDGKIAFIENDKGYFCIGGNKALNAMTSSNKPVCGYYVYEKENAEIQRQFKTLQFGFEYSVELSQFDFDKSYCKRIKNYALRSNYKFKYLKKIDTESFNEVLSLEGLSIKSKRLPRIGFLLSPAESKSTEWALAFDKDGLIAAIGVNPVSRKNIYTDNIISSKKRLAMDYCLLSLLEHAQSEEIKTVNLGAVPFQGLSDKKNIFYWGQYFNWLYSSKGLAHFKKTYATNKEPVFCYFDKRKSTLMQLYRLSKLHFYS